MNYFDFVVDGLLQSRDMMKFNMKLKGTSNNSKPAKVKVPKIEINECKVKTKDHKKLENEMLQQAKEAQLLLEQLLCEDRYDEFGRPRSNSLNATVENLILSKKVPNKATSKPRGSVPTLTNIPRKFLIRNKNNSNDQSTTSLPCSPKDNRRTKMSPLKFMRKYNTDNSQTTSNECRSPKSKRTFEPKDVTAESSPSEVASSAKCTSYKQMNQEDEQDESQQNWEGESI